MAFPHYVFDAGHELLGTFDDAEAAHLFAHDASRVPGTRLPVAVEDMAVRTSRLVWRDRCQSIRWVAVDRTEICDMSPVEQAGMKDAAVGVPAGRAGW